MIIEIPNNIRSEYTGYDFLISIVSKCKSTSRDLIVFDFGNVNFFDANLCALMGSIFEILESRDNRINIENVRSHVETILRKNEFLVRFGYSKIDDHYDTALSYTKFTPRDDVSFSKYIQQKLLTKEGFPVLSEKLGKEITRNIFEIYENARTHGKCDYIHTCGQFYPKDVDRPLMFTIVDKGVNIKQNVSKYLHKDIAAEEAIEWAMQKGNTTKTGQTSGGLGLAVIFDFIKLNRGKIQVVSADGFYEFKNDNVVKKRLNHVFDGTIVNIKFNLNDSQSYMLTEEVDDDFENIF